RAMAQDPAQAERLRADLSAAQVGLRWWAVVGLMLLDDTQAQPPLLQALQDEAHVVRIMAAWVLIRQDAHQEAAWDYWPTFIQQRSYASTLLYNCRRWAGEDARPLLADIQVAAGGHPGCSRQRGTRPLRRHPGRAAGEHALPAGGTGASAVGAAIASMTRELDGNCSSVGDQTLQRSSR
ncbi:MAG: hypothetical protein ACOCXJ_06085, partial [Planctomycetota bacterium]